jgi:hypothetical protein
MKERAAHKKCTSVPFEPTLTLQVLDESVEPPGRGKEGKPEE